MNPQPKTSPKDFFFHLGVLIALYASVIALLNLAFNIINYLAPDKLSNYFSATSIAWPISILVVLVPVLYVLEWLIIKGVRINSEKKDIWIRRWRIYLTLFLTGATIVVDLIVLINMYLGGEISLRFILKVLVVLIISGSVFKYYLFTINDKFKLAKFVRIGNAWFGVILVLTAIISGLLVIGSPAKQRELRFDEQRVNDLSTIQSYVFQYWQRKQFPAEGISSLPSSLDQLVAVIPGVTIPVDPENGSPYEYFVVSSAAKGTFELCATFDLPSQSSLSKPSYTNPNFPLEPDMQKHGAGQTCYNLFFLDGNY
jgi:hypothetical protein